MKFFVIYEIESLNNVLSSGMIILNGKYVFKKQPKITKNQVILKFNTTAYETMEARKVLDDTYIFIGGINLEGRQLEIICYDENQREDILKLGKIYKEFKDIYSNNISYNLYNNKGVSYIECEYKSSDILELFYYQNIIKMDKMKGFLYSFLFNNNIYPNYIVKKKSGIFDEMVEVENIIENLRNKKYLNKKLYYSAINFKSNIEKRLIQNINNLKKSNLIFCFDAKRGINLNKELFDLGTDEVYLLCIILNMLIKSVSNTNEVLINLIDNLKKVVMKKESLNSYYQDLLLIEKRIKNYEYSINIDKIKNIVLKNFYAFCIKYDNFKELNSFVLEKNIEKSYIANCIYGTFYGFSKLSNVFAKNTENDEITIAIIKKAIIDMENNFNSIRLNYYFYRDNLIYNINKFLQQYERFTSNDKCEILQENNRLEIRIKNSSDEKIIIRMYKRDKNISKNITYYDNKIKRISKIYSNVIINNKYYFDYRFKKGNLTKTRDYKLEYEFALIIKDLLNAM